MINYFFLFIEKYHDKYLNTNILKYNIMKFFIKQTVQSRNKCFKMTNITNFTIIYH